VALEAHGVAELAGLRLRRAALGRANECAAVNLAATVVHAGRAVLAALRRHAARNGGACLAGTGLAVGRHDVLTCGQDDDGRQ